MPFLRLHRVPASEVHIFCEQPKNSLRANPALLHSCRLLKRVSSLASRISFPKRHFLRSGLFNREPSLGSRKRRMLRGRASMTLEAAIALPIFLFFMLEIMSFMDMIGLQSRLNAALRETGNEMAFSGYVYDKISDTILADIDLPDVITSVAMTQLYAKNRVLAYVGSDYLDASSIKGGSSGLSFSGSIMEDDDIIEIQVHYKLQSPFSIFGIEFSSFNVAQCYYGRAWTGYAVEDAVSDTTAEDPMVYITETGTVYHTNKNCTYLNPSVKTIAESDIESSRNQSGSKYTACSICGGNISSGNVYVTNYGTSYHTSLTCSGLKRTIYTVALSEVGGRSLCSKCQQ